MVHRDDPRLPQNFWSKVRECPSTGCWLWQACIQRDGYGQFAVGRRRVLSHRLAYTTLVGPISAGLEIDHLCRVRECCNPTHLEPVTRQVNVDRGNSGLHNAVKTHCPKGHAYDGANLWMTHTERGTPKRVCRACRREISKRHDRKRKAQ